LVVSYCDDSGGATSSARTAVSARARPRPVRPEGVPRLGYAQDHPAGRRVSRPVVVTVAPGPTGAQGLPL